MRLRTIALVCTAVLSAASSVTAQNQAGDSLTPLQMDLTHQQQIPAVKAWLAAK